MKKIVLTIGVQQYIVTRYIVMRKCAIYIIEISILLIRNVMQLSKSAQSSL